MKKIILAVVAAAGLFAFVPAPASAQTTAPGVARSALDANAQVIVVRPGGGMRGERRMMRREMMRREMRRDMRRDRMRMDRRRMYR